MKILFLSKKKRKAPPACHRVKHTSTKGSCASYLTAAAFFILRSVNLLDSHFICVQLSRDTWRWILGYSPTIPQTSITSSHGTKNKHEFKGCYGITMTGSRKGETHQTLDSISSCGCHFNYFHHFLVQHS